MPETQTSLIQQCGKYCPRIIAASIVACSELYAFVGGLPQTGRPTWYRHGWPLIFAINIGEWLSGPVVFFSLRCLIIDTLIALLLMLGVAWCAGKCSAQFKVGLQFRLRTMLSVMAAIGIVAAISSHERALFAQAEVMRMEIPSEFERPNDEVTRRVLQPISIRLPLYAAVGCIACVCSSLILDKGQGPEKLPCGN